MTDQIPDLWGDTIKLDVLSPTMILNAQAELLQQKTKGLIRAELTESTSVNAQEQVNEVRFDLYSPAAGRRVRLLVIRYLGNDVYPVWVTRSRASPHPYPLPLPAILRLDPDEATRTFCVDEDVEFMQVVKAILTSTDTQAYIRSIIARANEAKFHASHRQVRTEE